MESVPVPVLSGRDSPSARMYPMRLRYWYSSCCMSLCSAADEGYRWPIEEDFVVEGGSDSVGSSDGDMVKKWTRQVGEVVWE
jgi:hypothetical protein